MIRITGGAWRGRKIHTPDGLATRPTPSRIREALFDVLGHELRGREFWDLYAGSGAVALEALSRGALAAHCVESSRRAARVLQRNVELLGCADRWRLHAMALPAFLYTNVFAPAPGAVVFADPPYGMGLALTTLEALGQRFAGEESAFLTLALQTERAADLPLNAGAWHVRKSYGHGDSTLWIYDLRSGG